MSRRDTIWKWVFYTAGVLLLLLLQELVLDHISLLHVHPYLPAVMVAVLAMFEGAYGGMGVAFAWLYRRTGTLWAAIGENTLNNAIALTALVFFGLQ